MSVPRWRRWSLSNKLTLIGVLVGVVGLGIALVQLLRPGNPPSLQEGAANVHAGRDLNVGRDLVVIPPNRLAEGSEGETCHVVPSVQSRIVARLYAREDIRGTPEGNINFSFQELFYEWKLTLLPDRPTKRISGRIDHLKGDDRFRVVPDDATLSPLQPRWFSEFPEPARKVPDYFARSFDVQASRDHPAIIAVRRPLSAPAISEVDIVVLGDLRSLDCKVEPATSDVKAEAIRLSQQATALAQSAVGGLPLPIRSDPGDVAVEEVQATVEAWCQTDTCERRTLGQLEVHMGRPPEEYFKAGTEPNRAIHTDAQKDARG